MYIFNNWNKRNKFISQFNMFYKKHKINYYEEVKTSLKIIMFLTIGFLITLE